MLSSQPVDWKIDPVTWELRVPLEHVSGAEGVAQRIAVKARLIRGELFTNLDAGFPWLPGNGVDPAVVVLGNPFNESLMKSEMRKIVESISGAGAIDSITATFDRSTRHARISLRCYTDFDDLDEQVPVDVVVEVPI